MNDIQMNCLSYINFDFVSSICSDFASTLRLRSGHIMFTIDSRAFLIESLGEARELGYRQMAGARLVSHYQLVRFV